MLDRLGDADEPELRALVAEALVSKGLTLGLAEQGADELAAFDDVVARFGADESSGVRTWVASALLNKAISLGEQEQLEASIAAHDELVTRFSTSDDADLPGYVASALGGASAMLVRAERWDEAIATCDELVAWFSGSSDEDVRENVARALNRKAFALEQLGRARAALPVYDELSSRFGEAPEPALRVQVAFGLTSKAGALGELRRDQEAIVVADAVVDRFGDDDDPEIRERVAWALIGRGGRLLALHRVGEGLRSFDEVVGRFEDDEDRDVRVAVAWARRSRSTGLRAARWLPARDDLRALGGFWRREILIDLVPDPRPWLSSKATRRPAEPASSPGDPDWFPDVARAKKDRDVASLLRALDGPNVFRRNLALRYLGDLTAIEAAGEVVPCLEDSDVITRATAARTLACLADPSSKPALLRVAREDPSAAVRTASTYAAGVVAEPSDRLFFERSLADPDWRVRAAALLCLGCCGDPASLGAVRLWQAKDRAHWQYVLLRPTYESVIRRLVALAGDRLVV